MTEKDNSSVALEFLGQLAGPEYIHIPKYIAYAGMAVIIKDIIDKTDEIGKVAARIGEQLDVILPLLPWEERVEKKKEIMTMPRSEFWKWLSAFTFSYLIVENFDALLALGGNLVGAVRLLAGL